MNKQIRDKIARMMFLREFRAHKRQQKMISFNEAKTIGVVYDSTDEKNFEIIKRYVKELREIYKKDVLALGYYHGKELPNMRFSKLGLDFFTRKNLNWHSKPNAPVVRNFTLKDFDILIDLHTGNSLPFRYVIAMTKAKFKIGRYERSSAPFYDFMISIEENTSLTKFIEQVNHYLNMLKHEPSFK